MADMVERDWLFVACENGHAWRVIGGRWCGCFPDACCSVLVRECSVCGECDYGDTAEAEEQRAQCPERIEYVAALSDPPSPPKDHAMSHEQREPAFDATKPSSVCRFGGDDERCDCYAGSVHSKCRLLSGETGTRRSAVGPTPAPEPAAEDDGALLPCPFCGGEACQHALDEPGQHVIECRCCGAASAIVFATKDDPDGHLALLWNRRDVATNAEPVGYQWRLVREAGDWSFINTLDDLPASLSSFEYEIRPLYATPTSAPSHAGEDGGWRDVLAERHRQIEAEGWTPAHDDTHVLGELARAAAYYAGSAAAQQIPEPWTEEHPTEKELIFGQGYRPKTIWHHSNRPSLHHAADTLWPFEPQERKQSDPRRMLVKAGALILAEIERLDRLPPAPNQEGVR